MKFALHFTPESKEDFERLASNPAHKAQFKSVQKALGFMESNLRHKGLNTHKYQSLTARYGFEVFESYAQNNTPGAVRIFWAYGDEKGTLLILGIGKHP